MQPSPLRISIIVPVLNEAAVLPTFLDHLRERAPDAEVVVVDGGSTDDTVALAHEHGARPIVTAAARGRAAQMNAGARLASGELFWFLHADSELPPDAVTALREALKDPCLSGGCFRLHIRSPRPVYRISDRLGNLGVDLFRVALGDHGIFCRREAFTRVGGFPEIPLMEDAEFYRGLRYVGKVRQLRPPIGTSPRRYERHGAWRTTVIYAIILLLYMLGVGPETLARVYRRVRD